MKEFNNDLEKMMNGEISEEELIKKVYRSVLALIERIETEEEVHVDLDTAETIKAMYIFVSLHNVFNNNDAAILEALISALVASIEEV